MRKYVRDDWSIVEIGPSSEGNVCVVLYIQVHNIKLYEGKNQEAAEFAFVETAQYIDRIKNTVPRFISLKERIDRLSIEFVQAMIQHVTNLLEDVAKNPERLEKASDDFSNFITDHFKGL